MPMKDRLCGFAAFAALLAVSLPLGSAGGLIPSQRSHA